jgi:putative phosphoribosyl transferase
MSLLINSRTLQAGSRTADLPTGITPLRGLLTWPDHPSGVVLVLQREESTYGREDAATIAKGLRCAGLVTLELDPGALDFYGGRVAQVDMARVAERARSALTWVQVQPEVTGLAVGMVAIGGAAAGALVAAASSPVALEAVVTLGGRPDLASDYLSRIRAPTLFLSGDHSNSTQRQLAAGWLVRHLVMERTWRAARCAN